MICKFCNQLFSRDNTLRCKKGIAVNVHLFEKGWPDPDCPVMVEYNQSILDALKEATNI